MEKKTNKVLLIIGIVLGILAVGFGSYFVYDKYFSNDDVVDKDDKSNNYLDNMEDNNKFNATLMSTEDRKQLLNLLVSNNVLEKATNLEEFKKEYDYYNLNAKIDDNGYFSITNYENTENYTYFGKMNEIYCFPNGSGIPNMLFVTQNNDLYYGIPYEYQVEKLENETSKTVISSYIDNNTGDVYVLFDDYSLINLIYDNELNKYVLNKDILDNDFIIDGLGIYMQCSSYCTPHDVIISFDGILKIKDNNDKYVEIKYNNKTLDINYGYYIFDDNYTSADIYLIDSDKNVYVINNYTESDRNTKLEKLSYKFESLTTNETYDIKYSNNSIEKVKQYNFTDFTKYSKIFDIYNKYN